MLEDEFDFDDETLPELTQEEQDWFTREAILASQEADEHPELLLTMEQAFAFLDEAQDEPERVQDAA